ncbi:hypothetical protein SAMN04490355_10678 [Pelosinus propionicus DSM 13327]|uniref:Uncharacterized protein n=1 Tax=Pelosinus propionicus DSM 13327 TaxID=1123291 RepID=A0A1I4PN69_9FIRM|nr:hypothetical protein SAMN04490355_10678 [Pelosinus propionicus DSM 13327]
MRYYLMMKVKSFGEQLWLGLTYSKLSCFSHDLVLAT